MHHTNFVKIARIMVIYFLNYLQYKTTKFILSVTIILQKIPNSYNFFFFHLKVTYDFPKAPTGSNLLPKV